MSVLSLFVKIVVTLFKKITGILPHLFHGLLDNQPLTACIQALTAPPFLTRENGFEVMVDACHNSLTYCILIIK